uniref:Uncharacterized protein n=1 Tax=Salmonella phage vB_STmST313_KE27 TaxID=3161178 RepID=A0AAU8GHK9_9CAUD
MNCQDNQVRRVLICCRSSGSRELYFPTISTWDYYITTGGIDAN